MLGSMSLLGGRVGVAAAHACHRAPRTVLPHSSAAASLIDMVFLVLLWLAASLWQACAWPTSRCRACLCLYRCLGGSGQELPQRGGRHGPGPVQNFNQGAGQRCWRQPSQRSLCNRNAACCAARRTGACHPFSAPGIYLLLLAMNKAYGLVLASCLCDRNTHKGAGSGQAGCSSMTAGPLLM